MSDEKQQPDSLQPSWAAHELFALALTLVLAVWVVTKYGKQTQPTSLTDARAQERAAKRAELKGIDEKALMSYSYLESVEVEKKDGNETIAYYRLPISDAVTEVLDQYRKNPGQLQQELVVRAFTKAKLPLDVSAEELALIIEGKKLFQTKACATCHQTDPAVSVPTGLALKATQFMGVFWGKEREVELNNTPGSLAFVPSGNFVKIKMDEEYVMESIAKPMEKVVKGSIPGMAPLPTTPEEREALAMYIKSLSK